MSDNILSAVLTFGLLAAGTAAMGTEMVASRHRAPATAQVVMLPAVTVIGHRVASTQVVMLPTVTVTGHRAALAVAYEPRLSELPLAQ